MKKLQIMKRTTKRSSGFAAPGNRTSNGAGLFDFLHQDSLLKVSFFYQSHQLTR